METTRLRCGFMDSTKRFHIAWLSTEHATSSYGLPVVTDLSNNAYGAAEVVEVYVSESQADHPLVEAARRAGYTVLVGPADDRNQGGVLSHPPR